MQNINETEKKEEKSSFLFKPSYLVKSDIHQINNK